MTFSYHIYVRGTLAATKATASGALALITAKWHGLSDVKIVRNNVVIWKGE